MRNPEQFKKDTDPAHINNIFILSLISPIVSGFLLGEYWVCMLLGFYPLTIFIRESYNVLIANPKTERHLKRYKIYLMEEEKNDNLEKIKKQKEEDMRKEMELKQVKLRLKELEEKLVVPEVKEFNELLHKYKEGIIKNYKIDKIKDFVKLNSFLCSKREIVLNLLDRLNKVQQMSDFELLFQMLNDQIHVLNQVFSCSLAMLSAANTNSPIFF